MWSYFSDGRDAEWGGAREKDLRREKIRLITVKRSKEKGADAPLCFSFETTGMLHHCNVTGENVSTQKQSFSGSASFLQQSIAGHFAPEGCAANTQQGRCASHLASRLFVSL